MRILVILVLIPLILAGCSSSSSNPVIVDKIADSTHSLLGTFEVTFDTVNLTSNIEPARSLDTHYNITSRIPTPVIQVNSWDPVEEIIDCDIMLHNPLFMDVFDLRFIIYTDSAGHELTNEDAWTSLFDIPGGLSANPFKAYAKTDPSHKFAGMSFLTENFKIKCPSGNFTVQFAVDASYPGNCEEPYEITNYTQGQLFYNAGSSTDAQVTVRDWQDDISDVKLHCKQVFGVTPVTFNRGTGDNWTAILTHPQDLQPELYPGYFEASSSNSGNLKLYSRVAVRVTHPGLSGWARTWGTRYGFEDSTATAVDNIGNVYTAVTSIDTAYLNKTSPVGTHLWNLHWKLLPYETVVDIYINKILVDNTTGNLYIAGMFSGVFDIDPGAGEDMRGTPTFGVYGVPGGPYFYHVYYAFLCKIDTYGTYEWGITWGGNTTWDSGGDTGTFDLCMDNDGNLLVTGFFSTTDPQFDLDPGPGVDLHEKSGFNLSRFNTEGNYLKAVTWDGWSKLVVEVNDLSEIYVGGSFGQTIDLDPGPGVFEKTTSGYTDSFICKLDNSFAFQNGVAWGGNDFTVINGSAIDSSGNILISGHFGGYTDLDPGSGTLNFLSHGSWEAYTSKFDNNLELQWAKAWGGTSGDKALAIVSDNSENVYITGFFRGTVDLDPGPGIETHYTMDDATDIFLISLESNGDFRWARNWGSTGSDEGNTLAINEISQIFIGGVYEKTVDFDPGPGIDNHTSAGYDDAFIMKILPNGYWYN